MTEFMAMHMAAENYFEEVQLAAVSHEELEEYLEENPEERIYLEHSDKNPGREP
ncbi:MAG: hypothetical protein ACLTW9_24365 [Enterocloster sp.]